MADPKEHIIAASKDIGRLPEVRTAELKRATEQHPLWQTPWLFLAYRYYLENHPDELEMRHQASLRLSNRTKMGEVYHPEPPFPGEDQLAHSESTLAIEEQSLTESQDENSADSELGEYAESPAIDELSSEAETEAILLDQQSKDEVVVVVEPTEEEPTNAIDNETNEADDIIDEEVEVLVEPNKEDSTDSIDTKTVATDDLIDDFEEEKMTSEPEATPLTENGNPPAEIDLESIESLSDEHNPTFLFDFTENSNSSETVQADRTATAEENTLSATDDVEADAQQDETITQANAFNPEQKLDFYSWLNTLKSEESKPRADLSENTSDLVDDVSEESIFELPNLSAPSEPEILEEKEEELDFIMPYDLTDDHEETPPGLEELSDQLKTFIDRQISRKKKPEPELTIQTSEDTELDYPVSETLAEVLVKQGKTDTAKVVYRKLMKKYPKKSSYFAAQIETINNQE